MTSTGEVFGSPSYMSPEQAMGQRVSESADQYALGCVIFECLTGSKPFISETPLAVMMQHMKDTPPSLKEASLGNQFPNDLELTVKRMLEKDSLPADFLQCLQLVMRSVEKACKPRCP